MRSPARRSVRSVTSPGARRSPVRAPSVGATASVASPSTSTRTASGARDVTARYPDAAHLMEDAQTMTGLDDFGPGDFREGLAILLESLERDADLSPSTYQATVDDLRRRLVNRLEVEAWYREHPEID